MERDFFIPGEEIFIDFAKYKTEELSKRLVTHRPESDNDAGSRKESQDAK